MINSKPYNILIAILCFLLSLNSTIKGQEPYYWQLTDDDGLPSMTVYKTIQDKNGLIWMGTVNGICSFDGKNIQKYNTSSLNDQEILKIQEGADGNIWGLNLSGQLFYLKNDQLIIIDKTYNPKINIVTDFVWLDDMLFIVNKSILTEVDEKILDSKHLNTKTLQHFGILYKKKHEAHFNDYNIHKDYFIKQENSVNVYIQLVPLEKKHEIAIISHSYLNAQVEILNNQLQFVKQIQFSFTKENNVNSPLFFWGHWNDNFYLNKSNDLLTFSSIGDINLKKIANTRIYSMATFDENCFFTLASGLLWKSNNQPDKIIFKNTSFTHVLKDNEGNTWLSTNGKGVMIVPKLTNLFSDKNNSILKSSEIYSINKIDKDLVIIGKKDSSLTIFNQNGILNIPIYYQGRIISVKRTYNGDFYVAGDNGIIFLDSQFKIKSANFNGAIKTIHISKSGINYFGSNLYFGIISKNSLIQLSYIRTYAIGETPDGLIWVGTAKGVFTFDGKNIKPFDSNELKSARVTAIATDSKGSLWITTQGHGVFRISQNRLEKIVDKQINEIKVFNCVYTEGDYVWLGSDQGIYRYNIMDNSVLHIDKYYGLPTNEITSLSIFNDNLLVGTFKGLTQISLESITQNQNVPEIHLATIKVNEIEQPKYQMTFDLSHNENNILIEYISYQYRVRGNVKYQYRIKELDTTWISTTERQLRLANLAPGNYNIEIRTLNENGISSSKNLVLNFYISKPFWLEWWFYLSILILASFGFAIYLRRKHSIELKMEDLRMQALQAQMNPHFIFNSLNAIQHFLTINDEDNAIKYLSKFARLIRVVFEYNKKAAISITDEIEMLQIYLSLEKLRFKEKINVHFYVSDELREKMDEIHLPPLLIQPIIENVFKHGLFHKKTEGNLWISFELLNNKFLKCVIVDDGIGRDAAKAITHWRKKHVSSGIITTEERLKFWHKKHDTGLEDYFIIEDLKENGIAMGTRITMII